MFQTSLILFFLLVTLAALVARSRREIVPSTTARSVVRARAAARPAKPPAVPSSPSSALEWNAPQEAGSPVPAAEDLGAKLRSRYVVARFPGMPKGTEGLREIERVINVARLYFEERKTDRALELLQMAVEESPADKSLRLAQLEIAFLTTDAELFTSLARDFDVAMPASPEWSEVCRLGRALLPAEPLFGASPGTVAHAHYGPWPDMPNWIQASWDLTGEVLAADFHRALARRNEPACANVQRRVA